MSDTDLELLSRYTRQNAECAFAELVRRHVDLVHSAALRQVRSPQLAEEVAQSTFIKLARLAPQLARDTILTAWLYQVTRREAIDVVRREARRHLREQIATEMNVMNATTADWTHIEPLLDEAVSALDDLDRAAVLLRYFENKSLREVGAALGTSDDAAQKRVSRAVERLREFFAKRGVTVGASGLVVVISANAIHAAPASLAVTISTAAALAGTMEVTTATATAIKTIAMTTLQKTYIAVTIAVLAGAGVYEARQATRLRDKVQTLQQQQAEEIKQLQSEREEALAALSRKSDFPEQYKKDVLELLQLRRQVAAFKKTEQERAQLENDMNAKLATAKVNLNAALANANFKLDAIKAVNNMKQLGLAFRIFSGDHPNQPLTNLDQLNLTSAPVLEFAQKEVEYVNTHIPNIKQFPKAILLREKTARQNAAGEWNRIYCFSDGSVTNVELGENIFDEWEKQNTQAIEREGVGPH